MNSRTVIDHPATSGWLNDQHEGSISGPAKEAFKEAVALFDTNFTEDERRRIWLYEKNAMDAVQEVIDNAKARYEEGKRSKARKWLALLSTRVLLYGRVLDVLAQQHPEYVSLVWGAIKFFFIGVMNHEELIKELAKALCRIADALPQAELQVFLYPTNNIRQLVVTLYTQIVKFVQRAATWYSGGKAKHFVTAFTRPYNLRFKDLVEEITETSGKIDRLALSMAMAELRVIRTELEEARIEQRSTHSVTLEVRKTLEEYHKLQYFSLLDTSRRVCEVQFSQILSFIAASPLPGPELSRQFYTSRRNRRRRKNGSSGEIAALGNAVQLHEWALDRSSSMIAVRGSFSTRHTVRDFAADVIDSISVTNNPVVWALNSGNNTTIDYTPIDVLKQIVSQALQQNHTLLNERSAALNAARFQSAVTENEWFSLVGSALEGLQTIYIVIDLEVIAHAISTDTSWSEAFLQLFDEFQARSVSKSQRRCQLRCQEAANVSSQLAD